MKEFPPFRLDTINQCLWRREDGKGDERILLTPKAFAVLRYLVEHAGRLVTQDELLQAVWPETFVQPEILKYQIADIRKTLGDRPKNPLFIETLPRRGYQFKAAVGEWGITKPSASGSPDRARLVGRDCALGELRTCLQRTWGGQRQIVFITGEPGVGKTALVDEFQRQIAAEYPSIRAVRGQCVEGYGSVEAYYPVLDALGQLCRGSEGPRVVEILAARAPTWLVQFPALLKREHRQTLQQEILGATRDRMLREVREALDAFTSEAPILLVFEDLQWADPSTVGLISALARQRMAGKLLLVLTKRPVDMVVPEHPLKILKQDLLAHHLCKEITLAPLSRADVAEYLGTKSLGDSPPEGVAELIHRQSAGNPLFMIAVLDHMTGRGLMSHVNGRWRLTGSLEEISSEVPETLRQIIEAQIDRLTTAEQRALEVASVMGPLFSATALAAVMKVNAEPLEELLQRLSRRPRIVRPAASRWPQSFEFANTLYREIFYRRQTPTRRAFLHRRVAEWAEAHLESSNDVAYYLADHFEQGADWLRAVKYLQLAAATAAQRLAREEAVAILRHALETVSNLSDAERAISEAEILETLTAIYDASGEIGNSEQRFVTN